MSTRVSKALKPFDPLRVENTAHPGFPDMSYIDGLLENKWVRAWPVKPTSPVLIPHFTQQQRTTLRRRWRMGGRAYLLLQVAKDWLLFNGEQAAEFVGRSTKAVLYREATMTWRPLNDASLRSCLSKSPGQNASS
jgi:hypothetical protein